MKILISPAKSLDFENNIETSYSSSPLFADKALEINNTLKELSAPDLGNLMSISPKLSDLNWLRNQDFQKNNSKQRQAIFAFNGDVYEGIDATSISSSNHDKLQNTLRILSGLYGILKPFDNIKPYRLEMGTKISIKGTKNLYDFWKKDVTNSILKEIEEDDIIVNLASNEYFSVIDSSLIENKIISPQFKDFKNGKLKIISFYAKKARGLMTRFLIDNDIKSSSDIENFNSSGYMFSKDETANPLEPVFVR
ncbi:MAG: peroxide stress protein YaaA [Flavobacteriaceae bacterium]|nr:peroxide stress protein YaaA [Flavobacteriaceae bacterium]